MPGGGIPGGGGPLATNDVETLMTLSAGFGSVASESIVAVAVTVRGTDDVATTVIVALAPGPTAASSQTDVVAPLLHRP